MVVNNTCCSCRELRLGPQHSHVSSQPPLILVPYPLVASIGTRNVHTCKQNIHTNKIKINLFFKKYLIYNERIWVLIPASSFMNCIILTRITT